MKSAIAIAAHPDDIEFLMAGTLMLLRQAGYQIHYWNLANGCCGTTRYDAETITRIRREEALEAATSIGAIFHESICNDLEIFYDLPTLRKVASVIREVGPEIVLTHSPVDYMEDHTNACRLAVTATFSRGMPNFFVDPPRQAVANEVAVYHAQPYNNREPLGKLIEPDLVVDVTDLNDKKREMLAKHASQRAWLDESQGLDSYLETMTKLDEEVGKMTGLYKYAEGWRRHLHMGFGEPDFDPLRESLKARVLMART
jgi:LmbE family N-acetylglucosaminyl deacetylase